MATVKNFEELKCWQLARELVQDIYSINNSTKLKTDFALSDQVRRAAISVMANIGEGFGRYSDKEFKRFLTIADGSLMEFRSLLYIVLDCEYISQDEFVRLKEKAELCSTKILGLINYLKNNDFVSDTNYSYENFGRIV